MTELGNRYAMSALKAKRAELAGEIAVLKKKLQWAETSLRHIDGTLNILEPTCDPTQIPAKRPQKRVKLFRQGQLGSMILAVLRRAREPLGLHEIGTGLLKDGCFGESARPGLSHRVRSNLIYQEARGRVTKLGKGRGVMWEIAKARS